MHIVIVALGSVFAFLPIVWQRYGILGVPLLPFIASAFGLIAGVQSSFFAPVENEDGEPSL